MKRQTCRDAVRLGGTQISPRHYRGLENEKRNCRGRLGCFLDFTVADAGCAGPNALVGAFDDGMDGLQIQVPAALGYVVRVADFVTELRSATADITYFRHGKRLPRAQERTRKLLI